MEMDASVSSDVGTGSKSQIPVCQTPFWRNLFWLSITHIGSICAIFLLITGNYMWQTIVFQIITFYFKVMGITVGNHRLWSHRSFKAKTPLKLLLLLCQTIAYQDSVIVWARDHRVHHKHTETDADPHNVNRGFLFSHIGWLFCRKSDACMSQLHMIDISDLEADPILTFQHKHYFYILLPTTVLILVSIPTFFWGEDLLVSFAMLFLRVTFGHHVAFLSNSVSHMWGYRPYDKSIGSADNTIVSVLTLGDGWHNYHHVFPWDYRSSEIGFHNFPTAFINFFAKIGWAYDLKSVSKSHIEKRATRTGDGSFSPQSKEVKEDHHLHRENAPWGWGDKDIPQKDKDLTQILYYQRKPNFQG